MTHALEYNSERRHLIIPEYGRHLQKMVEEAIEIEDDKERNQVAKSIIAVMGNMQPHLRDVPDFQHKLWDQLFIISDFKLDVESPFPKPTREMLEERPEMLGYPQNFPKYRFYGNNINRMINEVKDWEEGPLKEGLVLTIANHMKKSYLNWNRDTVEDEIIFEHLRELSGGKINLKNADEDLSDASSLIRNKKKHTGKNNNPKKSNRKGGGGRKRY
ncbi:MULTISPECIES: DUF4290 domain-containing protein [Salegentibacter]|uniref:DNA phosphorothioation-dependent restriction protein DptG n=1 Tax=Salegentibacter agarivorans TaxID=345907 RepID=A0A1I2N701_9FLAO|nr:MULTISPECIES: DUF4290 domain-containing protein [Salegentibacter]APS39774.1 methionyl-tRNA formyltransferase [Salegentibacter sp. T436]SFF98609.1 protein of unknown function [Salegentibacter agarivorans]